MYDWTPCCQGSQGNGVSIEQLCTYDRTPCCHGSQGNGISIEQLCTYDWTPCGLTVLNLGKVYPSNSLIYCFSFRDDQFIDSQIL